MAEDNDTRESRAQPGDQDSPPRDWLAGDPIRPADLLAAAFVGLAVLTVTFLYRTEIVPTDPWHYVQAALSFPSDSWVPLGYTRYGMILPSGPLAFIFGNAQFSYYFWPLFSSGLLAGTVYLLGRRWWGTTAGLLAVALLVSNSIVFINLSRFYPDVMSTALFCLAVLLALLARDRILAGGKFPVVFLLLVGFALGWGFEARETSMLAWPVIALILWRRGKMVRTFLWVLLPVVAWAALDVGIGAFAYGDPLLKVHTFTRQDLSTATNPADLAAQAEFVNQPRLSYLTVIPKVAARFAAGGWWMLILGVLATLSLFVRNKATQLMAVWFVSVYILFVGIAGMFFPAHPAGRLDVQRYWIQFFPPCSLAVAGLVAVTAGFVARRLPGGIREKDGKSLRVTLVTVVMAVGVAVVPTISLIGQAATDPVFAPNGATALQELRAHMSSKAVTRGTVWTDWQSARIMPIYQRGPFGGSRLWSASFKSLTAKNANPKKGDYVVLYSASDNTCPFCRVALRPWLLTHPSTPPGWVSEFTSSSDNLTVYRVS